MEENQPQSKNGMNPTLVIVAVVLIALIGFAFWNMTNAKKTDQKATETTTQEMTTNPTEASQPTESMGSSDSASSETTADTSEVKIVDVEAGSFYYKPNEIRVKKGQKVKIVMTSKDMMHDFNIDELNVKVPVTNAGETKTIEFTADQTGTFEYYCSVGQHRKMGQVGKLIVE